MLILRATLVWVFHTFYYGKFSRKFLLLSWHSETDQKKCFSLLYDKAHLQKKFQKFSLGLSGLGLDFKFWHPSRFYRGRTHIYISVLYVYYSVQNCAIVRSADFWLKTRCHGDSNLHWTGSGEPTLRFSLIIIAKGLLSSKLKTVSRSVASCASYAHLCAPIVKPLLLWEFGQNRFYLEI